MFCFASYLLLLQNAMRGVQFKVENSSNYETSNFNSIKFSVHFKNNVEFKLLLLVCIFDQLLTSTFNTCFARRVHDIGTNLIKEKKLQVQHITHFSVVILLNIEKKVE